MQAPKIVRAVVCDGAGTWFDKRVIGPVRAISKTLVQHQYSGFTESEIRQDMGLSKTQHLTKLFQQPHLAAQFAQKHFRKFVYPYDTTAFYVGYKKQQLQILRDDPEATQLVEGATELIAFLRSHNILIGLTSGYDRSMMDVILPKLAKQGFVPDVVCSSTERLHRSAMIENCLEHLRVRKAEAIACGDTVNDAIGARDANVFGVTISNEFTTDEQFQRCGTQACLGSLSDLKQFCK